MKSEELCIAKIESVSNKSCSVGLIFNGATEVITEDIFIDVAPHIETESFYDGDVQVETSHQVGEAGYKPFVDILKERYPNVIIIDSTQFNNMVEMQKQCASALVQ
jgi:hypothetical protein